MSALFRISRRTIGNHARANHGVIFGSHDCGGMAKGCRFMRGLAGESIGPIRPVRQTKA